MESVTHTRYESATSLLLRWSSALCSKVLIQQVHCSISLFTTNKVQSSKPGLLEKSNLYKIKSNNRELNVTHKVVDKNAVLLVNAKK